MTTTEPLNPNESSPNPRLPPTESKKDVPRVTDVLSSHLLLSLAGPMGDVRSEEIPFPSSEEEVVKLELGEEMTR
jgi:hypothetical protein